jgi:hypothetical protein
MKTQNTKLEFKRNSIVELNDNQLNDVNGGTSPLTITSSPVCSILASVAVSVASVIIIAETIKK